MDDVTKVLTEARDLIAKPERWTQVAYARDAQDNCTHWSSPSAVCWCAAGAIKKAAGAASKQKIKRHDLTELALDELRGAIGCRAVAMFNDRHAHAEVLERFDRAIEGRKA